MIIDGDILLYIIVRQYIYVGPLYELKFVKKLLGVKWQLVLRKLMFLLIHLTFVFIYSGFFGIFDKNNDDHIDFKEIVCAISLFCRGLTSERLEGKVNFSEY